MPNKDPLKHFLKQGETGRPLRRTLLDQKTGLARDLTGATVEYIMYEEDGIAIKLTAVAVVESPPTSGRVRYDYQAGDSSTGGKFPSEFKETAWNSEIIRYPSNRDEPSKRMINIHIGPN